MKRFGLGSFAVLALLASLARPAVSQSDLTFSSFLSPGGVSYNSFTVTTPGTFDIWTSPPAGILPSTPFDPVLYLFSGYGTGGPSLGFDDDGCNAYLAQCGPALFPFANSILNDIFLGVGGYTVAVGGYVLTEDEARSGINGGNNYGGPYDLRVASLGEFGGGDGVATGYAGEVVPEPATMTLLATGLAGMAAARRRRKKA